MRRPMSNPGEVLLEPVVLELARRGEGRDLVEAARGVERARLHEVVAGVEEQAREAERAGVSLGGLQQRRGPAHPAVLGGDVGAGELARRIQAQAACRLPVAVAQYEEGGEPVGRELLERQVDLGLVGGPAEVADGELGEVVARERDRVGAVGRLGADGPHGRDHIRVQRDERGRYSPQRPAGSSSAARARPARRDPQAQ